METADNLSHRVASFSYYLDTAKDHSLLHRSLSSALDKTSPNNPILTSSNPTMIKPPFTIKFSKPKEIQDSANLRLDSFSYRNTTGDHNNNNNNFVFEIPGPVRDPTSSFAFEKSPNKDGEIGIFGADKYFNMKLEYNTEPKSASYTRGPENPTRKPGPNNKIGPRTPSLSSEASSAWNYQTALLPAGGADLQSYGSHTKPNKRAIGRRIFNGYFGCKGPCFDKKSVHINEVAADGSGRIEHPAIKPVLISPAAANKNQVMNITKGQDLDDELSRNSIEVFGSSTQSTTKGDVATNMERKLSMLTWDAIPNKGQLLTSAPPTSLESTTIICDADMASDASSDLFEIENISGSSVYPLILKSSSELLPGEDDDRIPSNTCTSPRISHYAPSEASIQWSVVTASAADYLINLSDYNNNDEMSVSVAGDFASRANAASKTRSQGGKLEGQKTRHVGLLGCKSDKSVDVAENVCHHNKANEKVKNYPGSDLSLSFGKSGRVKDIDHALKSPRTLPIVL